MYKKLITLSVGILIALSMVACNNHNISSEEIESIDNSETIVNDCYNKIQENIVSIDGYIESKYENKSIDSDEFRDCQKSIRKISRDLEDVNMNEIKQYYKSQNNINDYNGLKNKYNQSNRSIKYINGVTNILKDDVVDDNEALDWICMREICNSNKPFSEEMKDNDEYKSIEEKYGFSLIDKQNEFDKKYEVKDIN